jgi:xanthine dehydrogenase YagR molybdenum-binding subunit
MSSVADWAAPNPVTENRAGIIGKAVDRYEGPLKVAGQAAYAYEVQPPAPPAYGVLVTATVAHGRIAQILTTAAEASPGVKLVWTHETAPDQEKRIDFAEPFGLKPRPALDGDRIDYFGQPVALVVADTLENATAAAALVEVRYDALPPFVDFQGLLGEAEALEKDPDSHLGDFEGAFAEAPVGVDETWTTPIQNHCQMEPCATVAWWRDGQCVIHTSVQTIVGTVASLAMTLRIDPKQIRLLTRYVGGGFGGKGSFYADLVLATLASRELRQPVKIAYTRQQMMLSTAHRPATSMRVRLAAEPDGRLTALSLMTTTHCDRYGNFVEPASRFARSLYAAPNRLTGHRLIRLDLPPAFAMRAPGEATGMLSLECAMDELAERLGLDPVELRIRNEPDVDPESGKPFSQRQLVRCLREGAQMFGWDHRDPRPGQVRDGRWLVGLGMAAAIRGHTLLPAKASFSIDTSGAITVRQAMTDIGTGSYTVLAQIAAETMGVPLSDVRVEIGDSELPPAPGSGGQFGAATAGSAVLAAGVNLRAAIAELAVGDPGSPLHGGAAAAVIFQDGMVAIGNRSESLATLIARAAPQGLTIHGESNPAADARSWSQHTYGAHFCEVGVDPVTGETRVRRMFGVFAAGRILNAKTARSQLTGGMIWGASSALTEGNAVDPRDGSLMNQDLASYLIPVQADIGEVEAIMLDEADDKAGPMGVKGVGELGIAGAGAAVANAVYNACGVRVRSYPITPDKLLAGLIALGR